MHGPGRIVGVARAVAWWGCALTIAGCGGGSPTSPAPTYENLAGTWTGTVGGVSQGVTLAGTITLTFQQSGGTLSGGYTVDATLTNPVQTSPLTGSVTLTGTVAIGTNPAVSFTTTSVPCPSLPGETWTGSLASRNGVLTITGTGHVISAPTCAIVLDYPQTITLTR